jgi:type II restriction enzyme
MNLNIYSAIAQQYKNNSQKIRVLSEKWVSENIFCPNCGNYIADYENNKPVADFYCEKCSEDFELKSKSGSSIGKKINDGAYETMIQRLQSSSNPNFFFLNYDKVSLDVINFIVIPKHFFVPEIIEKRKPLSQTAIRAGWVGCNILLNTIPQSGKIFYIRDGKEESKNKILDNWNKTTFLRQSSLKSKGWLLDIMQCIDKLGTQSFTLNNIYLFEEYLKLKYPQNNNIKAKIRQQLQVLRDKGYLKFEGHGKYKLKGI